MQRDRWSWRARAQGRAADTGSTRSAGSIGRVQEALRRITPKRLRCFGWLQRRTLIGRSTAWASCEDEDGLGVAQDYAEALRLFQLAAAQGHTLALFNVAYCYEEGQGVPKNKSEAIRWYRRAQAAGDVSGAWNLQRLRA